ncbi:release factor H-coupled R [Cucurbitaria berberidis CBS 394.84]|uniref:3'-phosphate/5'-hydroxy nucleic acid ligase n=1 Tax=Cucurbitaria berberidis CBS 394.84 TaxID=1168544 RepID=A0A9P4G893_9PLEO|nr:release factor H-coupled R [Cucurbitaria berberidis CBS 394.84]KAF1840857.1 release factor H-coupled R [Cucurbitaria berberidis CBS 394.84]
MPATRVTIASNAKQSQKAPLLIPASATTDPAAASSIREFVFKAAQSKLRLKKPTRIYVSPTGQELLTEEDWKNNIKDDVILLISAGEEYVGAKKGSSSHVDANPDCPVEVLASKAPVESLSVTQLTTTAHTLPGIVYAVGQPDLHPGTKFPIGAVFASRKWIHPPLIGSDIGCGMAWYKTTLPRSQVDGDKGRKVAEKLRGLEGAWRTQAQREVWLRNHDGSCSAGEQWDSALGTIGAGNHFAEIQVVEKSSLVEDNELGLRQDDVILLVHSGSRGYGGSILRKYTTDSHTSFEEGSPEATEYMKEHDKACQWAQANRDLIALRFLACLEPGNENWQLGSSTAEDTDDVDVATVEQTKKTLGKRKVVDIWHNNVERVDWPPASPSSTKEEEDSLSTLADATTKLTFNDDTLQQEYVYIHRKGAAPTYNPNTQLPLHLLPLPGSRGTPTLILKPTFSASTSWGLLNALSLAHGAGRAMSRAKALSSLSQKYKGQNILEPRAADVEGTWVICDEKDLVFEEAPDAYKDVEAVGQDLVDAGVASIVGWCRARVSYKVRNEAR